MIKMRMLFVLTVSRYSMQLSTIKHLFWLHSACKQLLLLQLWLCSIQYLRYLQTYTRTLTPLSSVITQSWVWWSYSGGLSVGAHVAEKANQILGTTDLLPCAHGCLVLMVEGGWAFLREASLLSLQPVLHPVSWFWLIWASVICFWSMLSKNYR